MVPRLCPLAILDDLIARTPAVVQAVRSNLPDNFPNTLTDCILDGLQAAAEKLRE